MPIKACQGCIKDMFITTTEAIDCFTGKQLWLWGQQATQYQGSGALGDNTVIARSSPIQAISGGTNWKQVDGGNGNTAAVKADGTLWVWGNNYFGNLGTNDRTHRSSPAQTIAGGSNWKQASVGGSATAGFIGAIKTDGTLWMWGGGAFGNGGGLGNNSLANVSSPVQTISGGTNWKSVSVGGFHTMAVKTDGTLWGWGFNSSGPLGDNSVINKSSPVQTISGGANWLQVSSGGYASSGVKTDGTLWIWGFNTRGQLGDNSVINKSSPVQTISGGTNWKQVDVGICHTAAIKTDGSLWIWGENLTSGSSLNSGKLGDNTNINRSSPVQTVSGGTNWRQVSVGSSHTTAVKTDGTLWSWGSGFLFSVFSGDNTSVFRSSPVQTISRGTSWKSVSAGYHHTMGIKEVEF
jgi:alpha-tubulin suppressor-like RCC1 family protein